MQKRLLLSAVSIFIFLQTAGVWAGESCAAEKPILTFQLKSGPKMFGIDDIIRFDWDRQIFELTRSAAMDFMARLGSVGVKGDKFILKKDGQLIIYEGTLVTPLSSFAFVGPVIGDSLPDDNVKPPLFEIRGGYPKFAEGDSRFSERLKEVLQQAGVLAEIDVNNPPPSIESVTHGWFGEKDRLKVLVEVFPETFRLQELARVHIHSTGGDYISTSAYVVDVSATLVANKGKFKYSTKRIFPAHEDGWKNIYIMGMNPWVSVGDSIDKIAEQGPAEISFDICLRKIIDEDKSLYSEPIESLKTGLINVVILPQEREPKGSAATAKATTQIKVWGEVVNGLRAAVEFVPEKEFYLLGEEIDGEVLGEKVGTRFHIQNVSGKTVNKFQKVGQGMEGHGIVLDAEGNELRFGEFRWGMEWRPDYSQVLLPNEIFTLDGPEIDIRGYNKYGNTGRMGGSIVYCKPGQYFVRFILTFDTGLILEPGKRELVIKSASKSDKSVDVLVEVEKR